ncbi:MAG: universal stress protein [Bacteroidota bacterium]
MKRILIPTDFSAIANNAFAYAVQVAVTFQSKLFLYHIYDIRKVDYDLDASDEDQPVRKEAERKMESTVQKFQELISGAKVTLLNVNSGAESEAKHLDLGNVEVTYREIPLSGDINTSIKNFVEQEDCDMLCMIKRRKGVFEALFSTSITKNQVFSNKVPLLVLPE